MLLLLLLCTTPTTNRCRGLPFTTSYNSYIYTLAYRSTRTSLLQKHAIIYFIILSYTRNGIIDTALDFSFKTHYLTRHHS